MPANLEYSVIATGLEKVSFHSNPKEGQRQRIFKLLHDCTHFTCQQGNAQNPSHQASTVCEPRTSRYTSQIQKRQRGTRDQIANICWIIEKPRKFQKNICLIDYAKAFDCVDHNKLWKILQEMEIPDYLTCLLRKKCAGQEVTFRTGHGTTDWFQIWKGVRQGCILSP